MKKLTAMFLSLMMCFSLMAVTAQAGFIPVPDPDGTGIVDVGGKKDTEKPGADEPQDKLPDPVEEMPME